MIRMENIWDEPISVKEWVLSVDEEIDVVRESITNGFEINDSIYGLAKTHFSKDWGLIIFKPITIPTDLEPICLNCRVTSDTWVRIFGHDRTKVVGMDLNHWLVRKTVDDIRDAKIRHFPDMSKGEFLLERFFVMKYEEECRKLFRIATTPLTYSVGKSVVF